MNLTHAISTALVVASALTGLAVTRAARAADSPLVDNARKVTASYLAIASALSNDETPPEQALADVIERAKESSKLTKGLAPEQAKELAAASAELEEAGRSMQAGRDLSTWRTHLRDLTSAVGRLNRIANGGSFPPDLNEFHCPMANGNWLQSGVTPANPYLGKSMKACGTLVKSQRGLWPQPNWW